MSSEADQAKKREPPDLVLISGILSGSLDKELEFLSWLSPDNDTGLVKSRRTPRSPVVSEEFDDNLNSLSLDTINFSQAGSTNNNSGRTFHNNLDFGIQLLQSPPTAGRGLAWKEVASKTSPQSFAIAFMNLVVSELELILYSGQTSAAGDSIRARDVYNQTCAQERLPEGGSRLNIIEVASEKVLEHSFKAKSKGSQVIHTKNGGNQLRVFQKTLFKDPDDAATLKAPRTVEGKQTSENIHSKTDKGVDESRKVRVGPWGLHDKNISWSSTSAQFGWHFQVDFPTLGSSRHGTLAEGIPSGKFSSKSLQKKRLAPTGNVISVLDPAIVTPGAADPRMSPVEEARAVLEQSGGERRGSVDGRGMHVDMDSLMLQIEKKRKQKRRSQHKELASRREEGAMLSKAPESKGDQQGPEEAPGGVDLCEGRAHCPHEHAVEEPLDNCWPLAPGGLRAWRQAPAAGSSETLVGGVSEWPLDKLSVIHGALVLAGLAPSLLGELQLLLQVLVQADLGAATGEDSGASWASFEEKHGMQTSMPGNVEPSALASQLDSRACSQELGKGAEKGKGKEVPLLERLLTGQPLQLFQSTKDAIAYACQVLRQCGRLLACCGEQVLSGLVAEPALARNAPDLLAFLEASLAEQRASALRSFKAYEAVDHRLVGNQSMPPGQNVPTAGGRPNVFLPFQTFQPDRDSRHNFKSQEQQRLFNNREQARDQFYALMRTAGAALQSGFSAPRQASSQQVPSDASLRAQAREFLDALHPSNLPWFAELFVDQIKQVAAVGETDPEVTGLAGKNSAKLQRLHERLTSSSRPPSSSQVGRQLIGAAREISLPASPWDLLQNPGRASSSSQPGPPSGLANGAPVSGRQVAGKGGKGRTETAIPGGRSHASLSREPSPPAEPGGWNLPSALPEGLRGHAAFLLLSDSYRLNLQVALTLQDAIAELSRVAPNSRPSADIASGFCERVLALRALALFLGFLMFPYGWTAGQGASGGGLPAPALVWRGGLDVCAVLEMAVREGSLVLNLPWALDFVTAMEMDPVAASGGCYNSALVALQQLYKLPLLQPASPSFGVSSMCILAALDGFFGAGGLGSARRRAAPDATDDSNAGSLPVSLFHNEGSDGPDVMKGIVDARYIRECCPLLVDMRNIVTAASRHRLLRTVLSQGGTNSPGGPTAKPPRKITPMVRLPQNVLSISRGNVAEAQETHSANFSQPDPVKLRLQRTFFEQRPDLRRLVDFVVDTVAANSAIVAAGKCLPPAMVSASCRVEAALDVLGGGAGAQGGLQAEGLKVDTAAQRMADFNAQIEEITATTIGQAMLQGGEYAKRHAQERTKEALAALGPPGVDPFVLGVSAAIAAEAAGIASAQRATASLHTQVHQAVVELAEAARQKSAQAKVVGRDEHRPLGGMAAGMLNLEDQLSRIRLVPGISEASPKGGDVIKKSLVAAAVEFRTPHASSGRNLEVTGAEGNAGNSQGAAINGSAAIAGEDDKGVVGIPPPGCSVTCAGQFGPTLKEVQVGHTSSGDAPSTTVMEVVNRVGTAEPAAAVNGTPPGSSNLEDMCTPMSTYPGHLLSSVAMSSQLVSRSCQMVPIPDSGRAAFRTRLAAVSVGLEGLLSCLQEGVPPGGFDAVLSPPTTDVLVAEAKGRRQIEQVAQVHPGSVLDPDNSRTSRASSAERSGNEMLLERALVLRTVGLSVRLANLDPWLLFGSSQRNLSEDINVQRNHHMIAVDRSAPRVPGVLMECLAAMWCSLVTCGIITGSLLCRELLAPWRWQALHWVRDWELPEGKLDILPGGKYIDVPEAQNPGPSQVSAPWGWSRKDALKHGVISLVSRLLIMRLISLQGLQQVVSESHSGIDGRTAQGIWAFVSPQQLYKGAAGSEAIPD